MTKRELFVGTITGVIGNIIYAVIEGIMEKSNGIGDIFMNILTAKIPLWFFLITILIAFVIVFITILCKKKNLAFLNHTEEIYEGFKFQWVWKLDDKTGHYRMADFWPICPECGLQLRVDLYDRINAYHCSNEHYYDFNKLYNLRRDLVHKIQRDYKEYASIIDYSY